MKRADCIPFAGLIATGVVASAALLVEAGLPVGENVHFLLQFLWFGIVVCALLAFALLPAVRQGLNAPVHSAPDVPELHDLDRIWLQNHPDTNWLEEK